MINSIKYNKQYVLGFIFDKDKQNVVLIHKNRPKWQKNKLNGLGGSVEEHLKEDAYDAIRREVYEESNLKTEYKDWTLYHIMNGPDYIVYTFFTFIDSDNFKDIISKTDEKVMICPIFDIFKDKYPILDNIKDLLNEALDFNGRVSIINYE